MAFEVGQEVVCVDDSLPANPWHRANPLVKGAIYVIRAMEAVHNAAGEFMGIHVRIDSSARLWPGERFRPLVKRKTDISIFKRMLAPRRIRAKTPN